MAAIQTSIAAGDYLKLRQATTRQQAEITAANFFGGGATPTGKLPIYSAAGILGPSAILSESGSVLSFADATNVAFNATTGSKIGTATTQKLAFHNATPVAQRAGAAQAAVATTAATSTTPFGYAQAQADAIVALLNEIRATLVEKGLMKGSS